MNDDDDELVIPLDDSDSSQDDVHRVELLWEAREETLVESWMRELKVQAKAHRREALICKKFYLILGLPTSVIPIVMTQFEENKAILTALLLLTGVLSASSTFLNLGKLSTEHYSYSNQFDTLSRNIAQCLSLPKKNRVAAGIYIERTLQKYNALCKNAPDLVLSKSIQAKTMV